MGRAILGLLACVWGGCSPPPSATTIVAENALPGDGDWQIDRDDGDPELGVFARPLSLERGEHIGFFASAPTASTVKWTVYRLGWYGGMGGRRYAEGTAQLAPQPPPVIDPATGLVECRWRESFGARVADEWTPGYYVVRLELADGRGRYAPFIVKDRRRADVIAVLPTATDQAYNDWGGESLYSDTLFGFPVGHAYAVSYDRPYRAAEGAGVSFGSSLPALRWLEANGYDVTYLADHDVGSDPSQLQRGRLVVSLAHDEYWSHTMRDNYEAARDAGVSLAFLGANTGFWQVRFEPADDGMPDRRQLGYKEAAELDPLRHQDDGEVTGAFAGPILRRPENALIGVRTLDWFMIDFPWVVRDAGSWIYAGTGLGDGALLPAAVGIEADALFDDGFTPAGTRAIARSPAIGGDHETIDLSEATVYDTRAGGFVFAAASIRFPRTLEGARAVAGAQRVVANVVARATGRPLRDEVLPAGAGLSGADWSTAASRVQTVAGIPGQPGFADGPATAAQLSAPLGLAVAPDGALLIADAGNHRLRRLDPPEAGAARSLTTIAGMDLASDAPPVPVGAFLHAWGVAVAPDGATWVSDPRAHRVTRVAGADVRVFDDPAVGHPSGIAVGSDGTVWLTDLYDGGVRTLAPEGSVHAIAITAADAPLSFPTGIALEGATAWIVDSGHRAIRRLSPDGTLSTVAGGLAEAPFADGDGRAAGLEPLLGIAQLDGRWLIADAGNYRLRTLEPGATSADTRVGSWAGRAARLELTDGAGPSAAFALPTGLAVDAARRIVYVADSANAVIRAVTP